MLVIVTLLLDILHANFPKLQQVMISSDNISCLMSHDIILYMHELNKRLNLIGLRITKWIYTEACTGKNRLDTHFSYVNLKLKLHVMDGNNVITEKDICEAISYYEGIAGTTAKFEGTCIER